MRKSLATLVVLSLICFSNSGSAIAGVYEDILFAANEGRNAEVIDLLRRGMDVNTTDRDGSSLLLIAARSGNTELADFLIKNHAAIAKRNRFGDNALLAAVSQGHLKSVEQLLAAGAEIDSDGWTALHYAAYSGNLVLVDLLIARGAKLDVRAPNGRTALMLATQAGHLDVAAVLRRAGADSTLKDYDGKTADTLNKEPAR